MKKLLVIVPFYNEQKFLEKSLLSLKKQTFSDFEVILIDDNSSDKSPEIARKFCEEDSRFFYIRNDENLGVSKSIKKHVDLSKYEFIARHDADDISLSKRFELQIKEIELSDKIAVIGTGFYSINLIEKAGYRINCILPNSLLKIWAKYFNVINTGSSLWRASSLREIDGFKNINGKVEGYATLMEIIKYGYEIRVLKSALYVYFIHDGKSHRSHENKFQKRNDAMVFLAEKKRNPLQKYIWSNINLLSKIVPKKLRNLMIGRNISKISQKEISLYLN